MAFPEVNATSTENEPLAFPEAYAISLNNRGRNCGRGHKHDRGWNTRHRSEEKGKGFFQEQREYLS